MSDDEQRWLAGNQRYLMAAVARSERHQAKGLFLWSRPSGLRQLAGPGVGATERSVPDAEGIKSLEPLSEISCPTAASRLGSSVPLLILLAQA